MKRTILSMTLLSSLLFLGACDNTQKPSKENRPPVAQFQADNTTVKLNQAIKLDASASTDPDGDTLTYHWDLGDGRTSTGKTVTVQYSKKGTYTIKLTVKDGQGNENSKNINITVNAEVVVPKNKPPVAHISLDPNANSFTLGQNIKLDASASTDPDGDTLTYRWEFNNNVATGIKTSTGYDIAGNYTIKLTVTDSKGASHSTSKTVSVKESNAITQPVRILVRDVAGNPLENAKVSYSGQEEQTDDQGIAFLSLPQNEKVVIKASKDQYLTQAVRTLTEKNKSSIITVHLLKAGGVKTLDAEQGGTINSDVAGSRVTFPANAFVDAEGKPVKGNVNVQLTPIDVTTDQLNAFPGNGRAAPTDGLGNVDLITLGMLDVKISQNGKPLQLAQGKKASLQMNLVTPNNMDGTPFKEGDDIPMWWFNKSTGLWVEEKIGEVAKENGKLVLKAAVSHFTFWNFDLYKREDRAKFKLTCKIKNSSGNFELLNSNENCYVRIRLGASGSTITTRSNYIPQGGFTIINVPPNTPFTAVGYARDKTGTLNGNTSSGNQTINLDTVFDSKVRLLPKKADFNFDPAGIPMQLTGPIQRVQRVYINGQVLNAFGHQCVLNILCEGDMSGNFKVPFKNVTKLNTIKIEGTTVSGTPFTVESKVNVIAGAGANLDPKIDSVTKISNTFRKIAISGLADQTPTYKLDGTELKLCSAVGKNAPCLEANNNNNLLYADKATLNVRFPYLSTAKTYNFEVSVNGQSDNENITIDKQDIIDDIPRFN